MQVAPETAPLTDPDCGKMRREMLERGFTLLDTPPFFDDGLFRTLKKSRLTLLVSSKRWWKFAPLARYGCWLEELLGRALPEEAVSLTTLEYRHERAGLVNEEVDGWHADGSYLRTVFTLFGPTTVYRDRGAAHAVPAGDTLVMTAQERTRALRISSTLHRRPGAGPERAVIVCSFEPRQEQPHLANVCQEVAQT